MTANLVRSYTRDEAHHLLNLSFAQYQADRHVVRMEARLERREAQLAELRELARSPFGDLDEYRRLREGAPPPPRQRGRHRPRPDAAAAGRHHLRRTAGGWSAGWPC